MNTGINRGADNFLSHIWEIELNLKNSPAGKDTAEIIECLLASGADFLENSTDKDQALCAIYAFKAAAMYASEKEQQNKGISGWTKAVENLCVDQYQQRLEFAAAIVNEALYGSPFHKAASDMMYAAASKTVHAKKTGAKTTPLKLTM